MPSLFLVKGMGEDIGKKQKDFEKENTAFGKKI